MRWHMGVVFVTGLIGGPPPDLNATFRDLINARNAAMSRADTAEVRREIMPDMEWVIGASGSVVTAGQFLAATARPQNPPPVFEIDSVHARDLGGVATVTYRRTDRRRVGAYESTNVTRALEVYVKTRRGWRLLQHSHTWIVTSSAPVPSDSASLASFVGYYEIAPDYVDNVHFEGRRLVATASGQTEGAELVPVSTTAFSPDGVGPLMVFERNASGGVIGYVQGTPDGQVVHARRVAPVAAPAAQPVGTSGYLTVDSSRIYYQECGSGPAIVLVHDGYMGSATWDAIWPDLCARFHVLRYDRRGLGRSSAAKVPFSQTADLAALLANSHITAATVVGSSAGGALAIDFALEHPDKVLRLVLLGPVVNGMGYSEHFMERNRANIVPVEHGDDSAAAANQANDRWAIAPGHDAVRRTVFETLMANPQNLQGKGDALEQSPHVPAVSRLGEVRVPTLILVGEYDIPDVHAHTGAIQLGIWGSQREIVPDAGHLVQLEQPRVIGDTITSFIAETPVVNVPVARLQLLTGAYTPFVRELSSGFAVTDGRLMGHIDQNRDMPLFASSDSTFYALRWRGFRVTFHRDARGRATSADVAVDGVVRRVTALGRS